MLADWKICTVFTFPVVYRATTYCLDWWICPKLRYNFGANESRYICMSRGLNSSVYVHIISRSLYNICLRLSTYVIKFCVKHQYCLIAFIIKTVCNERKISNLGLATHFWNNVHQVRSKIKRLQNQIIKKILWWQEHQKGLNMITKRRPYCYIYTLLLDCLLTYGLNHHVSHYLTRPNLPVPRFKSK
jgi:hypothetical protein